MTAWKDLEYVPNKWESEGIEFVPLETLIGATLQVEDFETFESPMYGPGVRILLSDDSGVKKHTMTYGGVIVKAFKERADRVNALIEAKEPVSFKMVTSQTGRKYISFA